MVSDVAIGLEETSLILEQLVIAILGGKGWCELIHHCSRWIRDAKMRCDFGIISMELYPWVVNHGLLEQRSGGDIIIPRLNYDYVVKE